MSVAICPAESLTSPHVKVWMRFPLPGSFHTSSPNVGMWWFFGKILKRFSVRKAVRVRKEPSFSRKPGPQLSLGAGEDGRQAAGPWGASEQAGQVRSHPPHS